MALCLHKLLYMYSGCWYPFQLHLLTEKAFVVMVLSFLPLTKEKSYLLKLREGFTGEFKKQNTDSFQKQRMMTFQTKKKVQF